MSLNPSIGLAGIAIQNTRDEHAAAPTFMHGLTGGSPFGASRTIANTAVACGTRAPSDARVDSIEVTPSIQSLCYPDALGLYLLAAMGSVTTTADGETEQRTEIMDRWINEETVNHPLQNFNFDDTNVKNEMANIANVYQQYALPLELGFVDVEDGLATLKEKLDQAGIEKVRQEMQTQLDEYLKNLK